MPEQSQEVIKKPLLESLEFASTMTPEQAEMQLNTEVEQDISSRINQVQKETKDLGEDPSLSETISGWTSALKEVGEGTFQKLRKVFRGEEEEALNSPPSAETADRKSARGLMEAYGGKKAFLQEAEAYAQKTREELERQEEERAEDSRRSLIDLQEKIKVQEEQKKINQQKEKEATEQAPTMRIAETNQMEKATEPPSQIQRRDVSGGASPEIETREATQEEQKEILRARMAELLGHEPRGEVADEIRMYEFSQPIKLNDPKLKEKMEARKILGQLKELEDRELDEGWEMPAGTRSETLPMMETLPMTPEEKEEVKRESESEQIPTIMAAPVAAALGMERSPGLPETIPMAPEIPETLSMEEGMDAIQSLREVQKRGGVEIVTPESGRMLQKDNKWTKAKRGGILGLWGVGKVFGWAWKGTMGFLDGMQKYILGPDLGAGLSRMIGDIKARFSQKKKE